MHGLNMVIPPLAPDYGGICSVLYGGTGMVVIHDASGCTINFTTYDEPRWLDHPSTVLCSGLRELDAVLGDDQRLVDKVLAAAADIHPRFIALVGSSVPMLIGTDLQGIARQIQQLSGIPSFGLDADGVGLCDQGSQAAQQALLERFAPSADGTRLGVGLVGDDALMLSGPASRRMIDQGLAENGMQAVCSLAMGDADADVARFASTQVNLVVTSSGLAPAEWLRQRYGTPYAVGLPWGPRSAAAVADRLRRHDAAIPCGPAGDVLWLGEALIGQALAETLRLDFGITGLTVGDIFSHLCPAACHLRLDGEQDVVMALAGGGYRAVIADPAFKPLVGSAIRFIPFPMVPVSGGIFGRRVLDRQAVCAIAEQLKEE